MYYTQAQKDNEPEYFLLHEYTNTDPTICTNREIFLITLLYHNQTACICLQIPSCNQNVKKICKLCTEMTVCIDSIA